MGGRGGVFARNHQGHAQIEHLGPASAPRQRDVYIISFKVETIRIVERFGGRTIVERNRMIGDVFRLDARKTHQLS